MADVHVQFDGADIDIAHLARLTLQPVLNAIHRTYASQPHSEIEKVLRRAGWGSFARDKIEIFAVFIAAGDRPVLTGAGPQAPWPGDLERFRSEMIP